LKCRVNGRDSGHTHRENHESSRAGIGEPVRLRSRRLSISEAATLLRVSPSALLAWEERFGYPTSTRSDTGDRLYALGELVALRNGLKSELSVTPAINRARDASRAAGES
jgi:hypothetical protein